MPTRKSSEVAAVLIPLVSLAATTWLLLHMSRSRFRVQLPSDKLAQIRELESRFHDCFDSWRPEMGVRSPCPKLHAETTEQLLELLDLQLARPLKLVRIIGDPEIIYENARYPGIFYWQFRHYWAVTAPRCVMLLPRNANYDAMMRMTSSKDGAKRASLSDARASTLRYRRGP